MNSIFQKLSSFLLAAVLLNYHYGTSHAQSDDAKLANQESMLVLPTLGPDDLPELENCWYSMPPWAEGLPFDLQSKFTIPPASSREHAYCQVFAICDPSSRPLLYPAFRNLEANALVAENQKAFEQMSQVTNFILERQGTAGRFKPLQTHEDFDRAKQLLAPFDKGIQKLTQVDQQEHCFFHSEWLPSSPTLVFYAKEVTYLLALYCNSEPSTSETLWYVETALQLKRDIVALGNQIDQIAGGDMERIVFECMVVPILQRADVTVPEIDQLIKILHEHDLECQKSDLCLEATKRETLELRHVMDLIATRRFNTEERRKRLSLDPNSPFVAVVLRELVDHGFYRVNAPLVREEIERLAQTNGTIREAWEKVRVNLEEPEDFEDHARVMLGFFLFDKLESMTSESLEREFDLLDKRYHQVAEACRLPYPDSTEQLRKLENHWTLDEAWRESVFLRWFLPFDRSVGQRRGTQLWRSAYLSLAAIRRWQRLHEAQDPPDLKSAFNAIGIEEVPVDPYSGKPLKLFVNATSTGTYSIGPDGKDDQAQVVYDPFYSPTGLSDDGDFIFTLDRQ